jgi:alpha-glucosidase
MRKHERLIKRPHIRIGDQKGRPASLGIRTYRGPALAVLVILAAALSASFVSCGRSGPNQARARSSLALSSPDGNLTVAFSVEAKPQPYLPGRRAYYRVTYKGAGVLEDSPLGLDFDGAPALDHDLEVTASERRANDSTWENPFGARRLVRDHYNELTVSLREKSAPGRRLDLVFRAYDDGVAFRYLVPRQEALGEFTIASESTGFYFAGGSSGAALASASPAASAPASGSTSPSEPPYPFAYALNMGRFNTQNEGPYLPTALRDIKPVSIINLPLLVKMSGAGPWVALLEADLADYAGMYVGGVPGVANALSVKLSTPPRRKAEQAVIGRTPKSTPWRVVMVATTPGRLIEANSLILNLNPPCALADTSWIKPGKAAWDWWSGSYATGVNFKPGMNTATMEHYIDFAAAHGLEYMLVDAGWAPLAADGRLEDILGFIPEANIPAIIAYGKAKGVRVLLWVEWRALDARMDQAMALYEKWGAAGIKVDYMNRDDQEMVNFYERVVRTAAAHHLVVDFHGAFKPTGLRRTYPNLLTREGVMGMEYSKWTDTVTPDYDATIPFTRMLAGPMDFTPGAFHNAARGHFKAQDIAPMSQGTRAHQLAMYVVYESPLVMVSDYPEAYANQPGFEFIEKVPTVWDDTRVLMGEPGRFIVVAREKGGTWYLGAMTNWDARDLEIPLGFLEAGDYDARVFADGPMADTEGTSLVVTTMPVLAGGKLVLHLAPGGGAAVILTKSSGN